MKTLFSLFLVFVCLACSTQAPKPLCPAFFCWETTLDISPSERGLMDSLGCKKLYVKILDIGLNAETGEIEPYSRTEISDTVALSGFEIIPTVFITNEVFQHISEAKMEWLAGKIVGMSSLSAPPMSPSQPPQGGVGAPLIDRSESEHEASTHQKSGETATPLRADQRKSAPEAPTPPMGGPGGAQRGGAHRAGLLIDCDWTPSTRKSFFLFLQKIRQKLPPEIPLSATIRLHQYKFPQQTGVPPVDRGMLMFYNTGDVDEESERNSIFHPKDALKYVEGAPKHYPLPLDLALPLFSWGVVFREGELWKIVPGPLPLEEMRLSGKYTEHPNTDPFATTLWELKEGTFLGGHYLRPGDRLRVSGISPEALFKIAEIAQKIDLADDASLAFFHLGIAQSEHFSAQLLDSVCATIRKYPISRQEYPMSNKECPMSK